MTNAIKVIEGHHQKIDLSLGAGIQATEYHCAHALRVLERVRKRER
jgi:hypothetical protein